ncbi:hypothetical protein HPB49_004610 [Dermacentor silvarum]|uniref:Uncharacterized protein n=1 Tax=Dermacentor silvarum TaxID=543639 RepID=A0ACB8DUX9_DERSI|nr:hypothetical protein HPB49_004610 [Dermacentor silvarum]
MFNSVRTLRVRVRMSVCVWRERFVVVAFESSSGWQGEPAVPAAVTKRKVLDMATKRSILKNKEKIASFDADNRKRLRKATYADIEDALLKWFVDARACNIPISGPMMLGKAKNFAFLLDFSDFCPGNGWLH